MATSGVSNNSQVSQALLDAMNPRSSRSGGTTAQDIQDRFMTMLVAQMKNQDPLNPMNNSEVTSQMAQLSTVSGIESLNVTMQALMGNYQATQNLQATSLIGRGVLVAGSDAILTEDGAGMGLNLKGSAEHVVVDIYDAAGVRVNSLDLGALDAGITSFTWDGKKSDGEKAAVGQYSFKVSATDQGGKPVDIEPLQFGLVGSVAFGTNGAIVLDVLGYGKASFSDVQQIL